LGTLNGLLPKPIDFLKPSLQFTLNRQRDFQIERFDCF